MKNIRKREIYAGVTTQTILFFYLCLVTYFLGLKNEATNTIHDGIVILTVPWFFSLFVAVGAYYHAVNRSVFALITLCVGAMAVMLFLSFFWCILIFPGAMSGLGLLFTILMLTLVALAGLTLKYAFSSDTDGEC